MISYRIIFAIAQKNLRIFFREWKSNMIVFLLPLIFIAVFAFAFGGDIGAVTFQVGLVGFERDQAQVTQDILEDLQNNQDEPLLNIQTYSDEESAREAVARMDVSAVLVWEGEDQRIRLIGDTFGQSFQAIRGIVSSVAGQVFFGEDLPNPVVIDPILDTERTTSGFVYLVPGLIVYGIIMLIPQVAITVAQEREKRYVFRYLTSQVRGLDVILGYLISHGLIIGFLQTIILFGAVHLFGYRSVEGFQSLIPALIIAVPTTLLCVGIGMFIGGVVRNSEESGNWGTIITIILGFLSGAFIQLPSDALIGEWSLAEIIPTGQASEALRQSMQFGSSLDGMRFAYVSLWAIAVVILGGFVYTKRQLHQVL